MLLRPLLLEPKRLMHFVARAFRSVSLGWGRLALAGLLSLALGTPGISAQATDLTGEWVFTVQSPNGTGTRQATLVQVGDSITGSISSDRATGDVVGALEDDVVTLRALLMMASGPFEVVYRAEVTDTTMTGTVDFGSYGLGTFTGRRAGDPSGGAANGTTSSGTAAKRTEAGNAGVSGAEGAGAARDEV